MLQDHCRARKLKSCKGCAEFQLMSDQHQRQWLQGVERVGRGWGTSPTAPQVQLALYLTVMRDSSRPRELKPHLGLKISFLFPTKAAVRPHAQQAQAGRSSAPVLPLCTLSNQGAPFPGGGMTPVGLRVSACLGSALQESELLGPVEVSWNVS